MMTDFLLSPLECLELSNDSLEVSVSLEGSERKVLDKDCWFCFCPLTQPFLFWGLHWGGTMALRHLATSCLPSRISI